MPEENSAETKPKVEAGGDSKVIQLVVKDQTGGEVHFKVKTHTKFQKIMDAYAAKKSLDVGSIRFLFEGVRLNAAATPAEVEMEDNDVIDCVMEQVGGL